MLDDKGSPDKCIGIFDKSQGVEQALGAEPFEVAQGHESFDFALDHEPFDVTQDLELVERPVEWLVERGIVPQLNRLHPS